jgi:hypothetical protein
MLYIACFAFGAETKTPVFGATINFAKHSYLKKPQHARVKIERA